MEFTLKEITIGKNDSGQRIDKFLKKFMPHASAGFIYRNLRTKKIKLNGQRAQPSTILSEEDRLEFYLHTEDMVRPTPQDSLQKTSIDFSVVYQDSNIMVADKPAGLLSHPDGGQAKTLTDQILYYLYSNKEYNPSRENTFAPAICNRLDRNTGGLIIAAKNFSALQDINLMIRERWVERYYKLIVAGHVQNSSEVFAYLVKDRQNNKVKISKDWAPGSQKIHTYYKPLKYSQRGYTLLEVRLGTGKTHQIRAHLGHIGHPVAGDVKYGDDKINRLFRKNFGLTHQFLYAYRLVFERTTPLFEYLKGMQLTVQLPSELRRIEEQLFEQG